ncbi:MAG: hypothetical protein AAGA03_17415, partial [Planctomycetota bacterium]
MGLKPTEHRRLVGSRDAKRTCCESLAVQSRNQAKVFALLIWMAGMGQTMAQGDPLQTLLDNHAAAVGAERLLTHVKSVHRHGSVSGQSSYGPLQGDVHEVRDYVNRRGRDSLNLSGYRSDVAWKNQVGWSQDTSAGLRDLSLEEVLLAEVSGWPSPLVAVRLGNQLKLTLMGNRRFHGKRCTVVTTGDEGFTFYLDPQTHLLHGMATPGVTATFADYEPVGGVQFPGQRTFTIESRKVTLTYRYESTKINEPVDLGEFDPPRSDPGPRDDSSLTTRLGRSNEALPADAMQLIHSLDKDGDEKISRKESPEDLRLFFGDYDRNRDGWIDIREARRILRYVDGAVSPSAPAKKEAEGLTVAQLMSFLDKNGDDKISEEEA